MLQYFLLLSSFCIFAVSASGNYVEITENNFDDLTEKGNIIVAFVKGTSNHAAFIKLYKDLSDVSIVEGGQKDLFYGLVDCSKSSNLCKNQQITKTVEIKTFDLRSQVDAVINFLNENANDICNEDEAIEKIKAGENVFMLFKIVSCRYCRQSLPIWKDVQTHFANRSKEVFIGKIDCTRQRVFCDEQGLTRYPKFYWFKKSKKSLYKGDRESSQMIEFAEQKLNP